MLVTITPKTKRAQNRVDEHGSVMEIVKEDYFRGVWAILVGCKGSPDHPKCAWCGWLTANECTWVKYEA